MELDGKPLLLSMQARDPHMVAWLLTERADTGKAVAGDLTPLRWAARQGDAKVVSTLLKGSANVNTRGRYGYTALMTAAMYGHVEAVRLLLDNGADVNTNGDGETAIDLAHRYPEITSVLERHVREFGWAPGRPGDMQFG